MKAKVIDDACIGCGACQAVCPEVFEIGDDGYADAKVENINDSNKDSVREAAESCPTGAIEVED